MRFIAHRANLYGPDSTTENHPAQILNVLNNTRYDVEIDVWVNQENEWFLGHDKPQYNINNPYEFLDNHRLWIHAKNLYTFNQLLLLYDTGVLTKPNVFSHDKDPVALTYPKAIMWTYPGSELFEKVSIAVMPEKVNYPIDSLLNCYGVCTDFPNMYKVMFDELRPFNERTKN